MFFGDDFVVATHFDLHCVCHKVIKFIGAITQF